MDNMEIFAALHDLGKIGIDDSILNKSDKLSEEEWIEMKKHPEVGYRIAMVDAYDAMTVDRVYRKALNKEEAMN